MDRWEWQYDMRLLKKYTIPFYSRILECIGVLNSDQCDEILNYEFNYAKAHLGIYYHYAEVHYGRAMLMRVFAKNFTKDEELEVHSSVSCILRYADDHDHLERVEGAPFNEVRWRTIGKLLRCALNIPSPASNT